MAFIDDLREFVQAFCASSEAKHRRENRLRQIDHEIAWTEREIAKVEAATVRRPSKGRRVVELRHQLRHRQIEYALLEAES